MTEILDVLAAPFAACLVLTGIHCYLGIHVVTRGVIFVDLSLAQVAALGTTVALLAGYGLHSSEAYLFSLLFTFVGAAIFALWRLERVKIPQEALIGIVFVVASAAAILVLDRAPHGQEEIKAMLVGSILWVTWEEVLKIAAIYTVVGAIHYILRRKFTLISTNLELAREKGLRIWFWDFIFYVTFGFVVTSSVMIAGVLLVFSYLVVPAVISMLFFNKMRARLLLGWTIGLAASFVGLYASFLWDLPTGAAVVTTFGLALVISALFRFVAVKCRWIAPSV